MPSGPTKKGTKEGASAETTTKTTTAERYKARAKNVRRRECIQITSASSGFQRKLIFFMICIKIFLHACFFQRLVVFLFLRRSSRLFSQTEERKRVPSPWVWGGAGSDRSIQGGGGLCCACVATCRGRKKRSHGQADNNNTAKERERDMERGHTTAMVVMMMMMVYAARSLLWSFAPVHPISCANRPSFPARITQQQRPGE